MIILTFCQGYFMQLDMVFCCGVAFAEQNTKTE